MASRLRQRAEASDGLVSSLRPCSGEVQACEQHVAQFAGIDHLVKAQRRRNLIRAARLHGIECCLFRLVGMGSLAPAPGRHRTEGRPGKRDRERLRVEWVHRHDGASKAESFTHRDVQLRALQPPLGGKHSRSRAKRTLALGLAPRLHAGVVGKKDDGQMERACDLDAARGFVRRLGIECARIGARIVGNDRDGFSTEKTQSRNHGSAEFGLDFEKRPLIYEAFEYASHLVGLK